MGVHGLPIKVNQLGILPEQVGESRCLGEWKRKCMTSVESVMSEIGAGGLLSWAGFPPPHLICMWMYAYAEVRYEQDKYQFKNSLEAHQARGPCIQKLWWTAFPKVIHYHLHPKCAATFGYLLWYSLHAGDYEVCREWTGPCVTCPPSSSSEVLW